MCDFAVFLRHIFCKNELFALLILDFRIQSIFNFRSLWLNELC